MSDPPVSAVPNSDRQPRFEWFDGDVRALHSLDDVGLLADGDGCLAAGRVVTIEPDGLVLAGYSAKDRVRLRTGTPSDALLTESGIVPGDIVAVVARRSGSEFTLESLELLVLNTVPTEADQAERVAATQGEVRLYNDPAVRRVLEATDLLLGRARAFLRERAYLELQLPVLSDRADISPNLPFTTTSSTGEQFHLRTTFPYFERVFFSVERAFQIGPMFRDEPAQPDREPEFNMLCLGSALCDYVDMMDLGEELVADLAREVIGRTTLTSGGTTVHLDQAWQRRPLGDLLEEHADLAVAVADDLGALWRSVKERGLTTQSEPVAYSQLLHSQLLDALLKQYVYPKLIQPTFVTEFPYYYGGPARPVQHENGTKMRAEAFVGGVEVGETVAFLTEPHSIDRWHSTVRSEKALVGWHQPVDEPFLDTMRRGIFPSAVIAFGIERLLMLLLESPDINRVAVFPGRRPRPR